MNGCMCVFDSAQKWCDRHGMAGCAGEAQHSLAEGCCRQQSPGELPVEPCWLNMKLNDDESSDWRATQTCKLSSLHNQCDALHLAEFAIG